MPTRRRAPPESGRALLAPGTSTDGSDRSSTSARVGGRSGRLGVFEPVKVDGRWLFDGAIVNPVPVSVARALGADRVIAFNILGEIVGRGTAIQDPFGRPEPPPGIDE